MNKALVLNMNMTFFLIKLKTKTNGNLTRKETTKTNYNEHKK